jgi:phenylacetate-coenzyme A ligase PaaK-like adenylate-forming protein
MAVVKLEFKVDHYRGHRDDPLLWYRRRQIASASRKKDAMLSHLLEAIPQYRLLLKSQYWNAEQMRAYSDSRLERVLRSSGAIPFYRSRFGRRIPTAEEFSQLPILRRAEIPELNRSVREAHPGERLARDWSSGSTGMPVEFLFDASHQRSRFAARLRYLRENGWNHWRRTAWLVQLNSFAEDAPDSRLLHHRLIAARNPHCALDDFGRQFAWLRKTDPDYLYTLPSNLEGLLPRFEEARLRLKSLRRIFTGGEVIDQALRERVEQVFGVAIADNYGSTETFPAWQCPTGSYHINAEHVLVEVLDENAAPVAFGGMGRVVLTTLENHLMPLVRYEIGDYVETAPDRCACGRSLPAIRAVLGRKLSLFRLRGGAMVSPWPLTGYLKAHRELKQFQIVQKTADRYVVRFVADRPLAQMVEDQIRSGFFRVLGSDIAVEFEQVKEIPRTRSRKYMTALSELDVAG